MSAPELRKLCAVQKNLLTHFDYRTLMTRQHHVTDGKAQYICVNPKPKEDVYLCET